MPVDGGAQTRADAPPNRPSQIKPPTTHADFQREWERYRDHKTGPSGGIEARTLVNIANVFGEENVFWSNGFLVRRERERDDQVYLNFNVVQTSFRKWTARMQASRGTIKSRPSKNDAAAMSNSRIVDNVNLALDQKLREDKLDWQRWFWKGVSGVCWEFSPWLPDSTFDFVPKKGPDGQPLMRDKQTGKEHPQQIVEQAIQSGIPKERFEVALEMDKTGDVGAQIHGPLTVFGPATMTTVAELTGNQSIMIGEVKPLEWVYANYPDSRKFEFDGTKPIRLAKTDIDTGGLSLSNTDISRLMPTISGIPKPEDPPMVTVMHRFGPATEKYPKGRYTVFLIDQGENGVLFDGKNPYHPIIPVQEFPYDAGTATLSVWSSLDYVSSQVPIQKFISFRMSQISEHADSLVHGQILVGGNLKASDVTNAPDDVIENAFDDNGRPQVMRVKLDGMGNWFFKGLDTAIQFQKETAGGIDLFDKRSLGDFRSNLSIPLQAEEMNTEWGPPLETHWQDKARVKQNRLEIVRRFYPKARTLELVGTDNQVEIFEFYKEQIWRAGMSYSVYLERGSVLPESAALREERVANRLSRLPGIYTDPDTLDTDWFRVAQEVGISDAARESLMERSRRLSAHEWELMMQGTPVPVQPHNVNSVHMKDMRWRMESEEFLNASEQVKQIIGEHFAGHTQAIQEAAQQARESQLTDESLSVARQSAQQGAAQMQGMVLGLVEESLRDLLGNGGLLKLLSSQAQRFPGDSGSPGVEGEPV